jgi:signal transduction histidine kinase
MTAAGLPVDLHVGELPPALPPGLDLAAFRVVQEALTNVLKHAGKPATSVGVDYRDGSLLLEVADSGRPMPAVGPVAVPGCGRGLVGLRERASVYGGEVDAGPRPGGGWLLRARIPVEAPLPSKGDDGGWPAPATSAATPVLGAAADGLAAPAAGR